MVVGEKLGEKIMNLKVMGCHAGSYTVLFIFVGRRSRNLGRKLLITCCVLLYFVVD